MLRKHLAVVVGLLCSTVFADEAMSAAPLSRHISYSFSVQNTGAETIPQAELLTYGPYLISAHQERVRLSASHSFELLTDEFGNQILHFTFSEFPPYGTKIITIEADLLLSEPLQSEAAHPPSPSLAERKGAVLSLSSQERGAGGEFILPERFCEVDEPAIVELTRELQGESELKTAKNIFRWVSTNIRYSGYLAQPRGARDALERRQGDCTEFMYLFMALCRASGIPARGLGGYVIDRNAVLKPSAYHNWAEFYLNGEWRLADPQHNIFMQNQSHYLVMRILGPASDEHPMRHYRLSHYSLMPSFCERVFSMSWEFTRIMA